MHKRLFVLFLALFPLISYSQWTLEKCVQTAEERNLTIQQNNLAVEQAKLNQEQSLGSFLPTLNGQVSHGYNWGQRVDPFTNTFANQRIRSNSLGLSTSVTLFNGFQQLNQYKKSEIDFESKIFANETQRNSVALQVAVAYLNILMIQETKAAAALTLERTRKQIQRIQTQVKVGNAAEGALKDMQAQEASDEAALVAAENNYTIAILDLTQLLLLDQQERASFELAAVDFSQFQIAAALPNEEECVKNALAAFPQVKAAEMNVVSNELALRIAKGGLSPRLNMSYTYGSGYSGASKIVTSAPDSISFPIGTVLGSNDLVLSFPQAYYSAANYSVKPFDRQLHDNINKSLFFSLNVPLFNGFNNDVNIKRAKLNVESGSIQLQQTKLQLEQEVRKAYADAIKAESNMKANEKAIQASQAAFTWNELRFNEGVIGMSEYLDARNRLQQAELNYVRSKYDWLFKKKIVDFYLGKSIITQP